jgi:pyridinium-3,5-biscarboxylic acid mononucleotide sulfurtransferase
MQGCRNWRCAHWRRRPGIRCGTGPLHRAFRRGWNTAAQTREVLEQVERGEESLRQLGFRELRVRHHGELARVEIARNELPRALTMEMMDAITAALKQAGFKYVTLDCQGFRSGAMNAVLPAEVLARRGA